MNKMISAGLLAVSMTLNGCSGHLLTVKNPFSPEDQRKEFKGIITYQPINVVELYRSTVLVDEKGNVIGSLLKGECIESKKTILSVRGDYSNPQMVYYKPGIFDSNKFALTLKDGVIASVNADSDPTAALKEIASILPFFMAPVAVASEDKLPQDEKPKKRPLCNSGDDLIGLFYAPEIKPYKDIPPR